MVQADTNKKYVFNMSEYKVMITMKNGDILEINGGFLVTHLVSGSTQLFYWKGNIFCRW